MTTTIPESAAPLLLGRYRPHTLIGRGGMASIFRAHDETLDRDVALKLFRAGGAADMDQHHTELSALARLSHHGIVSLIDAGVDYSTPDDPRPFLVMELVRGTDLQATLDQRELTTEEIAEIAYDLAEALEYVHANGVIHHDLKPSNVMLVEYGTSTFRARARLADFGIALTAAERHERSRAGDHRNGGLPQPGAGLAPADHDGLRRLFARSRAAAVLHPHDRVPRRPGRVGDGAPHGRPGHPGRPPGPVDAASDGDDRPRSGCAPRDVRPDPRLPPGDLRRDDLSGRAPPQTEPRLTPARRRRRP